MEPAVTNKGTIDKYKVAETERDKFVDAILESKSDKKVVVAGPGTGKTYLFKKILEGKKNSLTLTFVNSLVEDLALELYGLSKVKTLHSFGRSTLATILKKKIEIYPKLSKVIREDFQILGGGDADFDKIFHARDDSNELLNFYETRRQYYDYYGFTDVIFAAVKLLEADKGVVPAFEQVLIDEFQDFNKLEVSLIDLLAEKSPLLLAGDDDQALYEFLKHASAVHIRDKHVNGMPEYEAFNLPYCARCPEVVVAATNDLINAAKENDLLKERINKPFEYLPSKCKDKISSQFPTITHASYYARQIPWFIEKYIASIAEKIKNKFDVLIIAATNTQVRLVAEALKEKGLARIDYPDNSKDREINFFDGFNMLLQNKEDNLGWRIVASLMLKSDEFNELIKKTQADSSKKIHEYLSKEFVSGVLETVKALKYILAEKPVEPELLITTFKKFGIDTEKISSDFLIGKITALNPTTGNPAIRNIPIKVTTIQSSKGLSADIVFITNFDDRFFLKDGKTITDQDICNFLVAFTRTVKKAILISSVIDETPSLLKWISKEKIESIRQR